MKTLRELFKRDKEKFKIPKCAQDVIPVHTVYDDGIFKVGKDMYSKSFSFTDINYAVADDEERRTMFLSYSSILNSFDSAATTKITVNNRRINRDDVEKRILIPLRNDYHDIYRVEYNDMITDKITGSNSMIQDKYVTITICKNNISIFDITQKILCTLKFFFCLIYIILCECISNRSIFIKIYILFSFFLYFQSVGNIIKYCQIREQCVILKNKSYTSLIR